MYFALQILFLSNFCQLTSILRFSIEKNIWWKISSIRSTIYVATYDLHGENFWYFTNSLHNNEKPFYYYFTPLKSGFERFWNQRMCCVWLVIFLANHAWMGMVAHYLLWWATRVISFLELSYLYHFWAKLSQSCFQVIPSALCQLVLTWKTEVEPYGCLWLQFFLHW